MYSGDIEREKLISKFQIIPLVSDAISLILWMKKLRTLISGNVLWQDEWALISIRTRKKDLKLEAQTEKDITQNSSNNDIMFGSGLPGRARYLLAVACSGCIRRDQVRRRIILTRLTVVKAGRKTGFTTVRSHLAKLSRTIRINRLYEAFYDSYCLR